MSSYFNGKILGSHNQTPMALVQGVVSWRQRHGCRASDEATTASLATPSRLPRLALSELWRDGGGGQYQLRDSDIITEIDCKYMILYVHIYIYSIISTNIIYILECNTVSISTSADDI